MKWVEDAMMASRFDSVFSVDASSENSAYESFHDISRMLTRPLYTTVTRVQQTLFYKLYKTGIAVAHVFGQLQISQGLQKVWAGQPNALRSIAHFLVTSKLSPTTLDQLCSLKFIITIINETESLKFPSA